MRIEVTIHYRVLAPRTEESIKVENGNGITLGDVVSELDHMHVLLEEVGRQNPVQCQRISVRLLRWQFAARAAGVTPIVRMLGREVDTVAM